MSAKQLSEKYRALKDLQQLLSIDPTVITELSGLAATAGADTVNLTALNTRLTTLQTKLNEVITSLNTLTRALSTPE